jgi:hypothetical protein
MPDIKINGRIDLTNETYGTPLFLQDKIVTDDKTNYYTTIKHTLQPTNLSQLFLSYQNINIIQNGIKAGVYRMSNKKYIIDRQSNDVLNSIMSSIFLEFSLHQPDNITKQIEDLNKIVIDYCVPKIYGEIKGYIQYKYDASTLVVPLENPLSTYNNKELVLKNFF